jgi:putative hydrolase of the HAD superfamily
MQIKAVLFDLFDTLLLIRLDKDFSENCLRSVYSFLSANGVNVSYEDFRRTYLTVRKEIYERVNRSLEEPHFSVRVSQTLMRLGYNYDVSSPIVRGATDAYSGEFMRYVYLEEDAVRVLQVLRERGYRTGVISNFSVPELVYKILAAYGLKDFLDVIVISAEINRRKPSPEIFRFALSQLGVDASEAIFVGDTLDTDIKGAKNVGMRTVLIERKKTNIGPEDKPDFTIKRLSDLLNIIPI